MFNRGITELQDAMRENGNPPAEFNVNMLTAFSVTVRKGTSQGYQSEAKRVPVEDKKGTSRGYQSESDGAPSVWAKGIDTAGKNC